MDKNPFRENSEENNEEFLEQEQSNKDDNQENQDDNQENRDENRGEMLEEIQEEIQEDNKYDELNNKYLRLAADFDNFRKRTAAEKEELSTYTKVEFLKKLVTVLDTFDRAKEHLKDIEDCKTVKDSYEVACKQLSDTLSKMGLEEIEALGKEFDPNEHEAITQVDTDEYEQNTVAMVVQKGYKLGDKVVRPSLVGVSKKD